MTSLCLTISSSMAGQQDTVGKPFTQLLKVCGKSHYSAITLMAHTVAVISLFSSKLLELIQWSLIGRSQPTHQSTNRHRFPSRFFATRIGKSSINEKCRLHGLNEAMRPNRAPRQTGPPPTTIQKDK